MTILNFTTIINPSDISVVHPMRVKDAYYNNCTNKLNFQLGSSTVVLKLNRFKYWDAEKRVFSAKNSYVQVLFTEDLSKFFVTDYRNEICRAYRQRWVDSLPVYLNDQWALA